MSSRTWRPVIKKFRSGTRCSDHSVLPIAMPVISGLRLSGEVLNVADKLDVLYQGVPVVLCEID